MGESFNKSIDLLADSLGDARMPNKQETSHLKTLVDKACKLIKEVKEFEDKAKSAKKELLRLQQETIPEYMEDFDVVEMKFNDGIEISIVDKIYASISKANKEEAYQWLRDNDHGELIKVVTTHSVHHATVPSFVKECRANGETIPEKLFGVFDSKLTKIKVPK